MTKDEENKYKQDLTSLHKAATEGNEEAWTSLRQLRRKIAKELNFSDIGNIVASPSAVQIIQKSSSLQDVIKEHSAGDWGNVSLERELSNFAALKDNKGWIFSEFLLTSKAIVTAQTEMGFNGSTFIDTNKQTTEVAVTKALKKMFARFIANQLYPK